MQYDVFKYHSIDSTNIQAGRLLEDDQLDREAFVFASFQEAGKGRGTNSWYAPEGEGLLSSAVLFPAFLSVGDQFYLSKSVTMAALNLLGQYHIEAEIKWPNDILVEGRKIGGILIEIKVMGDSITSAIVGFGMNLNQASFPPFEREATSLLLLKRQSFILDAIQQQWMEQFEKAYGYLCSGKRDFIDQFYHERLYRRGLQSEFIGGGEKFQGMIRGVTESGELIVSKEHEERSYGLHEIKLLS